MEHRAEMLCQPPNKASLESKKIHNNTLLMQQVMTGQPWS
jgi:hypothetical protein